MPNPNCYGGITVVAMRVSRLAATGSPLTGANNGYVTAGVVDFDMKPDIFKGVQERVQGANNNICQYFRDCDRLESFDFTLNLCSVELDLIGMLIGATSIPSTGTGIYSASQSGKTVGLQFGQVTDPCTNGVCIEFWEAAWDQTQQAQSNIFAAPSLTYWHHVFPRTFWQIADQKLDNKFRVVKLEGYARPNSKITANGPFDDWDIAVANAGGFTSLGGIFLDDEFPVAACGPISVPSAAS